ncbi:hypothetical protein PT974_10477 [Cladobotryum mycophilum]|uniref:Uncharacterized protein n=1 Tax=Cladobotryum mycophilum TaxID=491253 RepID=A0ABR0S9Z1_9HYPO
MKKPVWQQGLVVSGFIAIGKSTVALQTSQESIDGYEIVDLDSSKFSFLSDGSRNPLWLDQYLRQIKRLLKLSCIVLVSAHADLRKALCSAGIYFATVRPGAECKDDYIRRIRARGDDRLTTLLDINWDNFVADCGQLPGSRMYPLTQGEYLTKEVLSRLIKEFKN